MTAGENDGATLGHEFAVLGMAAAALAPGGPGGGLQATLALPRPGIPGFKRRALAAWVTRRDELTPVQAAGGWLP